MRQHWILLLLGCLSPAILADKSKENKEAERPARQTESDTRYAEQYRPQIRYVNTPPQTRYVLSAAPPQQLPAEYISLLQQLGAQRGIHQVDPNDVQQLVISGRQQHTNQPLLPTPATTLSPESEQVRLQQALAGRSVQEQAKNDLQRSQVSRLYKQNPLLAQQNPPRIVLKTPQQAGKAQNEQPQYVRTLPQYYKIYEEINQPVAGIQSEPQSHPQPQVSHSPTVLIPRPQVIAPKQQILAHHQIVTADEKESARPETHVLPQQSQVLTHQPLPTAPPQHPGIGLPHEATPSQHYSSVLGRHRLIVPNQEPERISYSQVQFGSTELPRQRIVKIPKKQVIYATPQPEHHEANSYRPQAPTTYQPKTIVYQQPSQELQSISYAAPQESTPIYKQTPDQYLIETTRPVDQEPAVVTIPKRQPVYYRTQEELNALLAAQQSGSADAPSRSAIYVTQSSHSRPDHGHTLTHDEVQALVNAGFHTTSSSEYASLYSAQRPRFVQKRIPRPVALTHDERRALSQAGIRNLYRIEPSESQEAPITYVLALDSSKNKSQ